MYLCNIPISRIHDLSILYYWVQTHYSAKDYVYGTLQHYEILRKMTKTYHIFLRSKNARNYICKDIQLFSFQAITICADLLGSGEIYFPHNESMRNLFTKMQTYQINIIGNIINNLMCKSMCLFLSDLTNLIHEN